MNTKTKLIIGAIIIAGVSFFIGMKYGEGQNAAPGGNSAYTGQARTGGTGGVRGTRGAGAFNGTAGTIVSADATGITLNLRDGSGSKIIFVSPSTTIMKTTNGTSADLVAGKDATVMGTANADGSINAQSIQIRPTFATSTPN